MKLFTAVTVIVVSAPFNLFAQDIVSVQDCSLLRGLVVAADVLDSAHTSRSMDVNGWLAKFEANKERQRALSAGLASLTGLVVDERVTTALPLIQQALDATVDEGSGNVYYWRDMVNAQFRSYTHVRQSLTRLRDQICH